MTEAQFSSNEVKAITNIMAANQNDPAYVLGVLYHGMLRTKPNRHTTDPKTLREIEATEKRIADVLALREQWLAEYPELRALLEARW